MGKQSFLESVREFIGGIGGRIVVMTAFEWLQLCDQVVTEINRSAQVRPTLHAPDAAKTAAEKEK